MDSEALSAVKKGDVEKLKKLLGDGMNINAQDDNGRTLLHHAASNGKEEVAKWLLQNGADVLITTNKNNTALHIAAAKGDAITTSYIFDNVGRDKLRKLLDAKTKTSGSTALHAGAKHRMVSLILLSYGANYEGKNNLGERPIDLASFEKRPDKTDSLFNLTFGLFEMASIGHPGIFELLNPEVTFITPFVNSRNNKRRTLVQVLLLYGHVKVASEVLKKRASSLMVKKLAALHNPCRKNEIDEMVEQAKQCRDFWLGLQDEIKSSKNKKQTVKIACRMLEKVHEMLLAYRQFVGVQQSLTYDQTMKTLEDVFEVLGFDPAERYAVEGEEDCYYKKLSAKWKKDIPTFMDIMDLMVFGSIIFSVRNLCNAQMFHAVKENDLPRMKQLISSGAPMDVIDYTDRSVLCHASENGNKKMVKLLLKFGAEVLQQGTLTPIYLSARKGHAKVVKLLLEKADSRYLLRSIDWRPTPQDKDLEPCTALHAAAMRGRLDIVKMLLSYGATYLILDEENRTPLQVSSSQEVSEFLKLIDEIFREAKKAKIELVAKLKAMQTDEFLAVAGTRNLKGQTLVDVAAAKAEGKNITKIISKMIKEAK